MGEILFYRLSQTTLEATLPVMLERTVQRGQRAILQAGSHEALQTIDRVLWTYRDDSFLPHGVAGEEHAADQPILLSLSTEPINAARVLMLAAGARVRIEDADRFDRVALLFDAADAAAADAAREDWKSVVAAGLTAVYWSDETGRWQEKARSGA